MGVKVINLIAALNLAAVSVYVAGILNWQHSLAFFSLGGFRTATMRTGLLSAQVETEGGDFCRAVQAIAQRAGDAQGGLWCNELGSTNDIQDVSQRMCTPVMLTIWPGFCDGLEWAYTLGFAFFMVLMINMVATVCAMYLLMDYGHAKAKRKFRKTSMTILAVGICVTCLVLLMYSILAIGGLSDIEAANGLNWFSAILSVSKGVGFSFGHVLLWFGIILQLISLGLYQQTKSSKEDEEEDRKMEKKWAREQARLEIGQRSGIVQNPGAWMPSMPNMPSVPMPQQFGGGGWGQGGGFGQQSGWGRAAPRQFSSPPAHGRGAPAF